MLYNPVVFRVPLLQVWLQTPEKLWSVWIMVCLRQAGQIKMRQT